MANFQFRQQAKRPEQGKILDEFTAATGYHRKYAVSLLKGSAPKHKRTKVRRRPRLYNEAVKDALIVIWKASNHLCSKRLVPFLPELLVVLEILVLKPLCMSCALQRSIGWTSNDPAIVMVLPGYRPQQFRMYDMTNHELHGGWWQLREIFKTDSVSE